MFMARMPPMIVAVMVPIAMEVPVVGMIFEVYAGRRMIIAVVDVPAVIAVRIAHHIRRSGMDRNTHHAKGGEGRDRKRGNYSGNGHILLHLCNLQ